MIAPKYADMRAWFTVPGSGTASDGFPDWPGPLLANGSFDNTGATGLLRANGFANSFEVQPNYPSGPVWTIAGPIGPLIAGVASPLWPLGISINNFAADSVPGVDEYVWYLSQRSDGLRYMLSDGTLSPTGQVQYFSVAHPAVGYSGTVVINTTMPNLPTLLNDVALYVSRLSDQAYQWAQFVTP